MEVPLRHTPCCTWQSSPVTLCIVYFAICIVHAFHIRFGCREPWFRGTVRISARRRKAYLYAGHTHIETTGLSDCFYYLRAIYTVT